MLAWVAAVSIAGFIASLIAIPWILVRLPADYFDTRVERQFMPGRHPAMRAAGRVVMNVAGIVFLLAGIAMLVLPGQGILTILIGVSLIDFPGKRRMEARLVSQRLVRQAINAIRHRFGKPPLTMAPEE